MIRLILPCDYQEKVEQVIKSDNKEDICYAISFFLRPINEIFAKREIESIHPGQILVCKKFNDWLFNLANDKEIDIDTKSWGLMLVNQGPSTDKNLEQNEIMFLETENEYLKYHESVPEISRTIKIDIKEFNSNPKFYAQVVFMQGENANIPLKILNNQGEDVVIDYLAQWDYGDNHRVTKSYIEEVGYSDRVYETEHHILAYNLRHEYIVLYKKLTIDECVEIDDKIK